METVNVYQNAESISLPTILPLNQQVEMRWPDEDWTGFTDPAQRRKLQNRLHQRAWRRRQIRQKKTVPSISAQKGEVPNKEQNGWSRPRDNLRLSNPLLTRATSICTLSTSSITDILTHFEESAYQHYLLGSPRTDLLLTLVKFNVFRALLDNTYALGFTLEWLDGDAVSPFSQRGPNRLSECSSLSTCPQKLRPTRLQHLVEHHPWIDLFPIPKMRENILRASELFDEDALCHDMVEICGSPGERSGLVVWGEPWDPRNWEIGEEFLGRWRWVVQDCFELFDATNYWRTQRGEEKLFSDSECAPPVTDTSI